MYRDCLFILSLTLLVFSLLLFTPFYLSLVLTPWLSPELSAQWHAPETFLLLSLLSGLTSFLFWRAQAGRHPRIYNPRASIPLLMLSWIIFALLGILPFIIHENSGLVGALFESVSGLTTTGARILKNRNLISLEMLLWRHLWQWFGGLLTLLGLLLVIVPGHIPEFKDDEPVFFGQKKIQLNTSGGFLESTLLISFVYAGITLIAFLSLLMTGFSVLDALCLSLSTLSTGGLIPGATVLSDTSAQICLMIFMSVGGTGIFWSIAFLRTTSKRKKIRFFERSWFLVSLLTLTLSYILTLWHASDAGAFSFWETARRSLFNAISLITTTGFELPDQPLIAAPAGVIILFVFIGGSIVSTAGGLKAERFFEMLQQTYLELTYLLYPHHTEKSSNGLSALEEDHISARAVWALFAASLYLILVATLIFSLEAGTFDSALFLAVSSFSNIGPLYESGVRENGWIAFSSLSNLSKLTASGVMLLGRVDIIIFLSSLYGILVRR